MSPSGVDSGAVSLELAKSGMRIKKDYYTCMCMYIYIYNLSTYDTFPVENEAHACKLHQ